MEYSQSGSYVAIAGILVSILGHFGVTATVSDIIQVLGAIAIIVGVIRQFILHKRLATQAGAIAPKK